MWKYLKTFSNIYAIPFYWKPVFYISYPLVIFVIPTICYYILKQNHYVSLMVVTYSQQSY